MKIDLNHCFPLSEKTGKRGPLPKQKEFLSQLLDPKGPKFIAFVTGIGAGKTMCGCIGMLSMAVLYPGDYLIARNFYPELKATTYKTFLEICPKELIVEHKIAEMIIKVRSVGGKTSNIFFRPLEDGGEKLRSMNLSGFYIDEASQVPEAAFTLLQGRLRGSGLRKGFLTSNPQGHNFIYRWFWKKDHLATEEAKKEYYCIRGTSLENTHLPDGYIQTMLNAWSEDRINRELMGSWDAFEGQVFNEFRRDIHVIKPFKIPDTWERVMGSDDGFRNAAATLWGAVDYDGNVYIYREFYEKEWLTEEICKGKKNENKPGLVALTGKEKIQQHVIDPAIRQTRGNTGVSTWDTYIEHLPQGWPLMLAKNDVQSGIDRVKTYLKINERTGKPRLFIFDTCNNLIDEMVQYRWKDKPLGQGDKQNEKEEPVKHNDHACDALRYLLMSRPEAPVEIHEERKQIKDKLQLGLYDHIQSLKKPKVTDPFQDQ